MPVPGRLSVFTRMPTAAAILTALCVFASASATAEGPATSERAARFSGYITQATNLCFALPAMRCVEHGFAFADRNADQGLSADELTEVDRDMRAWWEMSRERLPTQANLAIGLGLLTTQYAGHAYFVRAWDEDGDGLVSIEELTADLSLDERPLPLLLSDERAVDWEALRGRLGQYGSLLDRLRGGS